MYTILIAEDDKILRNNLMSFLTNEGYSVLLAENGSTAYTMAEENIPDIIVSDINMPVMDGYELIKKLKTNTCTSGIPLIIITAEFEVTLNPENITGAGAILTKPFKLSDLLDRIESLRISKPLEKVTKKMMNIIDNKQHSIRGKAYE